MPSSCWQRDCRGAGYPYRSSCHPGRRSRARWVWHVMFPDSKGTYRRVLRWANLIILLAAGALALTIGPFR